MNRIRDPSSRSNFLIRHILDVAFMSRIQADATSGLWLTGGFAGAT